MPRVNYDHVYSEVKGLSLSDQLRLMEEMIVLVRRKNDKKNLSSILELRGKGKDIWKEVNVKNYIEKERSSWHG